MTTCPMCYGLIELGRCENGCYTPVSHTEQKIMYERVYQMLKILTGSEMPVQASWGWKRVLTLD